MRKKRELNLYYEYNSSVSLTGTECSLVESRETLFFYYSFCSYCHCNRISRITSEFLEYFSSLDCSWVLVSIR